MKQDQPTNDVLSYPPGIDLSTAVTMCINCGKLIFKGDKWIRVNGWPHCVDCYFVHGGLDHECCGIS